MSTIPAGLIQPSTLWGVYNNLAFTIQQALAKMQTATIVQVQACSNDGGVSAVGTVDVLILVNQINGQGNPTEHLPIYGMPYLRLQGGQNAVIIDPQPGDIGIALFASRDITNVKSTKAQANPGSYRMHDFSDGMFIGGLLNGTPNQYILFAASGINIVSPGTITLEAPNIVIKGALQQGAGNVTMSQSLAVTEDVTAGGISLESHIHSGVTAGRGETGPPA